MEFDLKAWRGRLGLTQEQAARQLGLTLRGYQKAEGNGPTRTLVLLAEILETHSAPASPAPKPKRERPAARIIRALEQAAKHATGEDVQVRTTHVQVLFGRPDEPFGTRLRPIKGGKTPPK